MLCFGLKNSILKYKKIIISSIKTPFDHFGLSKTLTFLHFFDLSYIFLDTLASEPLLPPRSSPVCNNPEHSDFTTSWWWKLGKDLLAVALKRLLLSKCSYYKAKKLLLQPNFFK